ncbi:MULTISPECIES: hypothetical protein [Rhodanobacter]|uniref:hypothetical protein n=1 Tax=Rhodanobacter TaxID=75309 RepID=UPI001E29E105|nr:MULTISPECIES: hypothetical protein [Rhodanobacter]UJM90522.1 hypothetical protein LRK24_01045 [Rhodanobacter denitrificans]UJM94053.1 hypothetical protein LRK32_01035 [Rhodanobacter denitrificans]UJM97582.1 hypothetical protein LRK44_01035 [Rhodanobacter denitrificans]UJN23002.1 hypothetical protein LRK54_07455 [Rhodanobacter denitrificans]
MSLPLLLPSTPLPSGWSIDPVTGHCVRISDGAQFGPATSRAIAWSTQDIAMRLPTATGLAVDVARLRNALGCVATATDVAAAADDDPVTDEAVHAVGMELVAHGSDTWQWQPTRRITARFHQRLGCFLDAIGVDRAHHPATQAPAGELWLLTGRIGHLAIRSESIVRGTADATVMLLAQGCASAGDAMQRARTWAIEAACQYLVESAEIALALVRRVPFHEHDSGCAAVTHAVHQLFAGLSSASAERRPTTPPRPGTAHGPT